MLATMSVGHGQNPQDFTQHPAVAPEAAVSLGGSPDGGTGFDRIDAAEYGVARFQPGPVAVFDGLDLDGRIDLADARERGQDLGHADVGHGIALGRAIGVVTASKSTSWIRGTPMAASFSATFRPMAELSAADARRPWLRRCRKKPWVVYSQAPFAGPRKLLDYLGRYTHRVAISNHRILACKDGQVHYHYRDRRDGNRLKTDSLPAEEFLRRFLQHVLPDRFLRIRHYGLLANCVKVPLLTRCRQLLGARPPTVDDQPQSAADWMRILLGIDITRCPCCGKELHCEILPPVRSSSTDAIASLPRGRLPPWDTS